GKKIVHFVSFLREMGFRASQSALLNSAEAVINIGLEKEYFRDALKCALCSDQWEWSNFDNLFDLYFCRSDQKSPQKELQDSPIRVEGKIPRILRETDISDKKVSSVVVEEVNYQILDLASSLGYSPFSALVTKEIQRFSNTEIQAAQALIKNIMRPFRPQRTRRLKRRGKNRLDLKYTMRAALKNYGWPLRIFYLSKKKKLRRLVIIADVSGSMQRFNAVVIPFLLGLKGIGPKAEVFVFSTRAKRITELIRHVSLQDALKRITGETPDWSGGTRIGESLSFINRVYGKTLLNKGSVVAIISDGWDLGPKPMLLKEMKTLHERVHRVLWVNPIAGDPKLSVMSQAVKICMPYIHYHLPAGSLKELSRATSLLGRLLTNGKGLLRR
ncbi:MAG: vWA domain-containing protein, partial [Desulfatiglandales bacterium]